jgi:hypothetical protein
MSTSPTPTLSRSGCSADVLDQLAECQRMLTAKQLANILAVSPKTIYSYVERNIIPHYKIEASVRFRACSRFDATVPTIRSTSGVRTRRSA